MGKGRVLTKRKWRNGQRRKPKNTYRSFKFPRTGRSHKEFDGVHLSMGVEDTCLLRMDKVLEFIKY